jgi:hypothetical protein
MHLIWGGFNALVIVFLIPIVLILLGPTGSDTTPQLEFRTVFGIFGALIITLSVVFGVPPIVAGYAMLKRKSWARVMGIISSCLVALSFPFGTALCVYTLWFLFGEGERFYTDPDAGAGRRGSLRDGNTFDWESQRASGARRPEYVPPPQPPDWRG